MVYHPETTYLKSVTASYIQSFEYAWDDLGNMTDRYDHLHKINNMSLHEHFTYDNRSQLRTVTRNGVLQYEMVYDNLGNITSKTASGGMEYQSANSPYQLTSIVPDQSIDPGYKLSQNITYTDFNKVESITGNGYELEIEYGLGNQRISQSLSSVNQYGQTTLLLNKHFIGGLQEKIFYETGTEKTISYITSPEGLTAIEVKSGITSEWYTVFTDHLGSITTLIRESDGLKFELSYDAWGNRRDPATWTNYSRNLPDFITITDSDFITDRGFTGHEHLDMFGLINMNGRVYDPVASRFLSPDSFIQAPELALNYNGYVYCLNNPLVYTDPSGEIVWFVPVIVGAVIGAYLGGSAAEGWEFNPTEWAWDGDTWAGIGIGAVVGGAAGLGFSAAAPALANTGFFAYFGTSGTVAAYTLTGSAALGLAGYGAGFSGGMLNSNGDFNYSHKSGLFGAMVGSSAGAILGNIAGNIETYAPPIKIPMVKMPKEPKWYGPYFRGSEEEAREMLLSSSRLLNVETSYWYTSKGYYFEPTQGEAYGYRYDPFIQSMVDYNVPDGFQTNEINKNKRYTYVRNEGGVLYLQPPVFNQAIIYSRSHTHPNNGVESPADLDFSRSFGIRCSIFGWNGIIYNYGGPRYWK